MEADSLTICRRLIIIFRVVMDFAYSILRDDMPTCARFMDFVLEVLFYLFKCLSYRPG